MCILFEIGVAMHTVQLLLYSDSSTAVAFVLMMQAYSSNADRNLHTAVICVHIQPNWVSYTPQLQYRTLEHSAANVVGMHEDTPGRPWRGPAG